MKSSQMKKGAGLLGLVFHRSFSRTTLGLRFTQGQSAHQPEKSWINTSCFAVAVLGLSLSLFSTRQLTDDPNRRCLLWRSK